MEYKYKYNGKELEDELGKNTYAFGWRDYDPAIGRFNKIDRFAEKYQKLTPYGYAGNSPVLVNDIQGDSLWISFGRNNESRVLYQNGQLLNKDGSRYEGKGVKIRKDGSQKIKNSFLNKTKASLDKLSSTDEGRLMIADIQSSNFSVTVNDAKFNPRNADRNEYIADNLFNASFFQGQNQKQGIFTDIGSGGNVFWNPNDLNAGTLNEVGGQGFRPVTNLGHELFHGFDGINGNLDSSLNEYGLPVKEMRATYSENLMRSDLGYPLRSTYNNISVLNSKGAPIYQEPPSVLKIIAN